jgi:hypothetical protein
MLIHLRCIIAIVLYVIVSTDAINCKGCVPLDIFTFDKVSRPAKCFESSALDEYRNMGICVCVVMVL